jgi:hypothetical protein
LNVLAGFLVIAVALRTALTQTVHEDFDAKAPAY